MRLSFRGKKSRGRRSLPPGRSCAQVNGELVWPMPARLQTLPSWRWPPHWGQVIMFPVYWPPFPYIQPRRCAAGRGGVTHKHKWHKNVSGAGSGQLPATQALPHPHISSLTCSFQENLNFCFLPNGPQIQGHDVMLRSGSSNGPEMLCSSDWTGTLWWIFSSNFKHKGPLNHLHVSVSTDDQQGSFEESSGAQNSSQGMQERWRTWAQTFKLTGEMFN